jgi:hypothetical protein
VSRIDRLGEFVSVLRRGRIASSLPGGAKARTASAGGEAERTLDSLRTTVSSRLRAVEGNERDRKRARARIFVESVLVWEFGEDLLGDPEFDAIVGRVEENLLADDQLADRLGDLLDELSST